ncbi:Poly(A)+ RNA export protein [Nosema granulosis]|uniref:Poly(A)+ RNA export protein n=1 Tax=Nosema granulosis TaxID=83296 RepID=A0A9P6GX29_9MICR|nr:Poly(A)+ RNA export protein [Nosema granulosis]
MNLQTKKSIFDIQNPSQDTISEIAFSTLHKMMLTSSWDGTVRLYNPETSTGFLSSLSCSKPVLSCSFSKENPAQAYASSPDGTLYILDLEKSTVSEMKAHEDGIKAVRSFSNTIITGSWDRTVKFWDTRTAKVSYSVDCPGKVYGMDLEDKLLAVACSGNKILSLKLDDLKPKETTSRLSYMFKSIGCGTRDTILVGSLEGKCELFYHSRTGGSIVFRSHRKDNAVYSVNTVAINPQNSNMIATGGSNGDVVLYDCPSRGKLISINENHPITAGRFTTDGLFYIYSTGNDWSRGYETNYIPVSLKVLDLRGSGINV